MFKPWYLRFNVIRLIDSAGDTGGSSDSDEGQGDPGQNGQDDQDDERLGEGGMKALKAEREANKQLKAQIAELNDKVKAFEDKDKSESEKQAERIGELEKTSASAIRKATQYEVAAAKGIPLSLATRLRGETKEEMEADAEELLPLINQGKPRKPNPKSDPSQGQGGAPKPASLSDAISMHYQH